MVETKGLPPPYKTSKASGQDIELEDPRGATDLQKQAYESYVFNIKCSAEFALELDRMSERLWTMRLIKDLTDINNHPKQDITSLTRA